MTLIKVCLALIDAAYLYVMYSSYLSICILETKKEREIKSIQIYSAEVALR